FLGDSLDNIRLFSDDAKDDLGFQLDKVQNGEEPDNWKPLKTVSTGVREIRTKVSDGIYRTVYIAKFEEAIYVLYAFQKKDKKTAKSDIALAKKRFKELTGKRR
ncbi:MAG: type II toxin-antitoxin system RelE/ParE family toxin, partial [gamma proteobacterium symbiont of Lucinoma myriamae]|nr:type II toxin-antitoxin system RelE/ParE family toxin [gamma proteobacterium symbiont of Lucinoma myriamae]MCU7818729.1 type II toxin-antitoxin system RelE/ParE family toxin [gamma proteobacterium symbiont of Lucinoma myriamae]